MLDLKGQMTLGEGDEMLKDKCKSIMASGRRKLVLNLGAVPYIDSAGLGEIVRSYTLVSRLGGRVWLSYPTKRISDLLSITKLEGVFEIAEPEELRRRSRRRTPRRLVPDLHAGGSDSAARGSGVQGLRQVRRAAEAVVVAGGAAGQRGQGRLRDTPRRDLRQRGPACTFAISDCQTLTVENRLDLFASEVARRIWRFLPPPRRVVFTVEQSRFTAAGLEPLLDRCAASDDQERAAVGDHRRHPPDARLAAQAPPPFTRPWIRHGPSLDLSGEPLPRFCIRVRRE